MAETGRKKKSTTKHSESAKPPTGHHLEFCQVTSVNCHSLCADQWLLPIYHYQNYNYNSVFGKVARVASEEVTLQLYNIVNVSLYCFMVLKLAR